MSKDKREFCNNLDSPLNHLELSVETAQGETMMGSAEDRSPACSNQPEVSHYVFIQTNSRFTSFQIKFKDTLEEASPQASGCPHPWWVAI